MKKILVIEDNPSVLSTTLKMLKAEGFWAIGAENGLVGLLAAQKHLPNLIICDIMMPQLDGYGVLSALRQNPSTSAIPFIFLTAKVEKTDFRQGMELGSDDYLTKPFTRDELLSTVKAQLDKQLAFSQHYRQKLDHLRSNIAQSLPHQLLIPVVKVLGLADILVHNYHAMEAHEVPEIGSDIQLLARDLHRMIQNFLLYAELEIIESDSQQAQELRHHQTSSAHRIITELAEQKAKHLARSQDLQLALDLDPAIAVQISDHYLEKIVLELVDNAFKFSTDGTPVTLVGDIKPNHFVLSIGDRGQGMTETQIAELGAYMQFEHKLYRQQGSGLGLAIAKRLVELHGGSLTIESIPYEQTVIRVVLPINSPD